MRRETDAQRCRESARWSRGQTEARLNIQKVRDTERHPLRDREKKRNENTERDRGKTKHSERQKQR